MSSWVARASETDGRPSTERATSFNRCLVARGRGGKASLDDVDRPVPSTLCHFQFLASAHGKPGRLFFRRASVVSEHQYAVVRYVRLYCVHDTLPRG